MKSIFSLVPFIFLKMMKERNIFLLPSKYRMVPNPFTPTQYRSQKDEENHSLIGHLNLEKQRKEKKKTRAESWKGVLIELLVNEGGAAGEWG